MIPPKVNHDDEDWARLIEKLGTVNHPGIRLSEVLIRGIEDRYGVTIPADYREFLKRIGDASLGPRRFVRLEDGLTETSRKPFPLTTPLLGPNSPKYGGKFDPAYDEWEPVTKDDGVMHLCEFREYNAEAVLMLNGPFCGKVWMVCGDAALYGPFGGSEFLVSDDPKYQNWVFNASPHDYSFFEWYDFWLDSGGDWRE